MDQEQVAWQVNRALQFQANRDYDSAEAIYQKLVRQVTHPDILHCYGDLLLKKGLYLEAIAKFKGALTLSPKHRYYLNSLGLAYRKNDQLNMAINSFENAIKMAPDVTDAYLNLGNVFRELKEHVQAINSYQSAITLNKRYVQAYYNMALTMRDQGELQTALNTVDNALSYRPDYGQARMLKGEILERLGHVQQAEVQYRLCSQQPLVQAQAFWSLANLGKATLAESDVLQMQRLLDENSADQQQIYLRFSLAKACEDNSDFAKAYKHLTAGNTLKRAQLGYSSLDALAELRFLQNCFNHKRIEQIRAWGQSNYVWLLCIYLLKGR
jgi:tetratricopeptide (TPR) repeat protein